MDLDQTMWQIAERADTRAAAEFSEKFPALADDMKNRMDMVSGMKDARRAIAPASVPAFVPRYLFKPRPIWMRYGPAALGIAALAGASYYVTQNIATPLPDPSTFTQPAPKPAVQPDGDVSLPPAIPLPSTKDIDSPVPFTTTGSTDNSDQTMPTVEIKMTQVHLLNVIQAIAKRYHTTAEVASGMQNPVIDMDLTGNSAISFLNGLGNLQGFTAYDEGKNTVLVVPARDSDKTAKSSDSSSNP